MQLTLGYRGTRYAGWAVQSPSRTRGRPTVQGSVETSNVDLANELAQVILAQRGFSANSRMITTSDEILQDLVNLKH